jgi:hypothetical protein
VHLHTRLITSSKCSSTLARSQPPSLSPNSRNYGIYVHTSMASKCINTLARRLPPSSFQTCSFTAFRCISTPDQLWPPCSSPMSLDHGLQLHHQTRSIRARQCIPVFTRSSFSGAPQIAVRHSLRPVQIYRVSHTLLQLTHLSLHFISAQTLLEASSD